MPLSTFPAIDAEFASPKIQSRDPERLVKILEDVEVIDVIMGAQNSPTTLSMKSNQSSKISQMSQKIEKPTKEDDRGTKCGCTQNAAIKRPSFSHDNEKLQDILREKEIELQAQYETILKREIAEIKEKFDHMLQNEQMRVSYMLREAHRERREKVKALESQLECQNLAALVYVMCAERTRSRLEKLQLTEEYTSYIRGLQDLLMEGQQLILSLSRGYKTAARVDHEWRVKMKKVVKEFMNFIYHFAGGPPESNQYLMDLPKLLTTEAPIESDPNEDPCEEEEEYGDEESANDDQEKPWWQTLEGDDRPFVMFGDMSEFKPPQRRDILNAVKATKTAPSAWKSYAFRDMYLKRSCGNANQIKDIYPHQYKGASLLNNFGSSDMDIRNGHSKQSLTSRRQTALSIDIRGGDIVGMGSILKIITSAANKQNAKTTLLGARDSMEITSTTKLKHMSSRSVKHTGPSKETKLDIGKRRPSHDDPEDIKRSQMGSLHSENGNVVPCLKPVKDFNINYERVCPVKECQRLQVDSFIRSLPSYMRANPFNHFQQTFENYETCTPEQLEILKQRLDAKNKQDSEESLSRRMSPMNAWEAGIATQTSIQSGSPSCTCAADPSPTPADSNFVFNVQDLLPVKLVMDAIQKDCLYDDRIDFNRFKVVGEECEPPMRDNTNLDFKQIRSQNIIKILKKHPSLLDIFQADARG